MKLHTRSYLEHLAQHHHHEIVRAFARTAIALEHYEKEPPAMSTNPYTMHRDQFVAEQIAAGKTPEQAAEMADELTVSMRVATLVAAQPIRKREPALMALNRRDFKHE